MRAPNSIKKRAGKAGTKLRRKILSPDAQTQDAQFSKVRFTKRDFETALRKIIAKA